MGKPEGLETVVTPTRSCRLTPVKNSVLSYVTANIGMLWEVSQIPSLKEVSSDSYSLPEREVDVTQWAEGVPRNPARVACFALRWLREDPTPRGVLRLAPPGRALAKSGSPSFLFFRDENVASPLPWLLTRGAIICPQLKERAGWERKPGTRGTLL